jgi:hypothetical protein
MDWKQHRMICETNDNKEKRSATGMQKSAMSFVEKNYFHIMRYLTALLKAKNVDSKEAVLVVSFYRDNETGTAPALRDPPEFQIGITKDFIRGDRPDEPDWFFKGTPVYEKNIDMFVTAVEDMYRRMTELHLLVIVRDSSGSPGVYRVQLHSAEKGTSLFSPLALDAFGRALDGDDSLLDQAYGPGQIQHIKSMRDVASIADIAQLCRSMRDQNGAFDFSHSTN